jgi:DNA-binding CsgD family transcriptional regulator
MILLDSSMMPISWNSEALQVLTYPEKPASTKRAVNLVLGKLPERLNLEPASSNRQTRGFLSGRRQYTCTLYSLDMSGQGDSRTTAILLERVHSPEVMLYEVTTRFNLTMREREAVGYLLQGLTSKQVAQKMNISTNTVKAFLRLVMTKMAVSTRTGLIGRIAGLYPAASDFGGEPFGRGI